VEESVWSVGGVEVFALELLLVGIEVVLVVEFSKGVSGGIGSSMIVVVVSWATTS
jgi:hypothetical protein